MTPKKQGGQVGNGNAHKHGLYARHVSPDLALVVDEAAKVDPYSLEAEIVIARALLTAALGSGRANEGNAAERGLELVCRLVERHARVRETVARAKQLEASDRAAPEKLAVEIRFAGYRGPETDRARSCLVGEVAK